MATLKDTEQTINDKIDPFEKKAVAFIFLAFVVVMLSAWIYSFQFIKTLSQSAQKSNTDLQQIIDIEKMRNETEAQIASSRSYFLLGTKSLFDDQLRSKSNLQRLVLQFQASNKNSEIEMFLKQIEVLLKQQEEFFDQAVKFRESGTESRIVGQFYHSKASPIRDQINSDLNSMSEIIQKQVTAEKAATENAALAPQKQFPKALAWLTGLLFSLFVMLSALVTRLISKRKIQEREKTRLYFQAQKAVLSRDELLSSVAHELNEPLAILSETTDFLLKSNLDPTSREAAEIIKSSVSLAQSAIRNLVDQTQKEDGVLTLRLEQQGLSEVFEEVRLATQAFAKKKDVKLQFDAGNPPLLAFFDKDRVTRILQTLVSSAIRTSPRNGRLLVKTKSDQQFVHVSLIDSGPQGSEKELSQRWDSAWQEVGIFDGESAVSLGIVKTIVEAHGGSVEVENLGTGGSRFVFTLPRRRPVGAHVSKPGIGHLRATAQTNRTMADRPETS